MTHLLVFIILLAAAAWLAHLRTELTVRLMNEPPEKAGVLLWNRGLLRMSELLCILGAGVNLGRYLDSL